jgi:hypothetical protein
MFVTQRVLFGIGAALLFLVRALLFLNFLEHSMMIVQKPAATVPFLW